MDITLLDGSIGQELMKRSDDAPTALWSTLVMIEHPELVGQVHAEYFRVGATIATTNTYPVLQDRLDTNGYDLDIRLLWDAAIKSARNAAQANGHGLVAGSIGPLIATYRPDICPEPADAEHQYTDIVAHLAAHTDFLLIETVSSLKQAEGALRATDKTDKPVWIAFSVDGPAEYAKFAMHWIDQGATIVGGCCEVGPEHIQELAKQIKDAGHNIV
ncbi:MAG: homocysteine S-methyltransferase family protein [Rhodobacteraceae bacterium]|nr:homocysteine S-methyltransferase family protein [Paracoccaceae bacterium]